MIMEDSFGECFPGRSDVDFAAVLSARPDEAAITSKSGAGRHALAVFAPCWHPIIDEALRAREQPDAPSAFRSDAARRGRDTTAFTRMAIESSLACGP